MYWHIANQIPDHEGYQGGVTLQRRVEVTSAEMLALATTAKELVPAPGADRVLEFVSAVIKYKAGSTGYTEPSAPDEMVIQYSGGQDVCTEIDSTNFIDQTDDEIRQAGALESVLATTVDLEALKNTSLVLFNSGGNWTGGTGTLDVRINYRVHDFS
jgi:hypothetical protein